MVNQTIPRPSLMVYAPGDSRLRSIPYFHGMWTLGYTETLIEQHRITSRYMRSLVYLTNELSSQHVCMLFHMKPLSFMLIMLKLKPVAQLICWPPNQWRIQDFIFGGYRIIHKGEVIWAPPPLENFKKWSYLEAF